MAGSGIAFAVVATPPPRGRDWTELARRLEGEGWSALLVPDTLWTASPFPALAAAGAVTATLRLRTWVLAAPFRSPGVVAREASALQQLTEGRFELGIGAGRPDAEGEAERLGAAWGSPSSRVGQVAEVVAAVRESVRPTPAVVVAGAGRRLLTLAAQVADRVALALPPTSDEQRLAEVAHEVRTIAGRQVPLTFQVVGLGDRLPSWMARQPGMGASAAALARQGAVGVLPGDPAQVADALQERRERYGLDEVVVPAELADDLLPVLQRLG